MVYKCTFSSLYIFLFAVCGSHEYTSSSSVSNSRSNPTNTSVSNMTDIEPVFVKVSDFKFHHLEPYLVISLFILYVIFIKLLLHRIPKVSSYVPESCVLLLHGILAGFIMSILPPLTQMRRLINLGGDLFFFFLLPPIVLEAAYGLQNRVFYSNLVRIIIFAVVGTVCSAFLLTLLLTCVTKLNWVAHELPANLGVLQLAYFSSFIVAVDPVAVLAIFEELGVELSLYFLVFGESLFNDAVTIVLYNIMEVLMQQPDLQASQIILGIVSFFTISLGGLLIGLICGILSCLITRISKDIESIQPLILLIMGYLSYVLGDLFGWSGLVSLIVCGIIHNAYAFHNISNKSVVTVKRVTRMLAHLSEAVIFLFLGMELLLKTTHYWEWSFTLWALVFSILVRAVVIFGFCAIMNSRISRKKQRINFPSQVIITYGGLRGAVAYALAAIIPLSAIRSGDPKDVKGMFVSTTLVIVLFTNLIMGTTMKPLVKLLHIKRAQDKELSIFREMGECILEQVNTTVEEISGYVGTHTLLSHFQTFNNKYLKRILLGEEVNQNEKIVRTYQKVSMALHMATVHPEQAEFYLNRLYNKSIHSFTGLSKVPTASDLPLSDNEDEIKVEMKESSPKKHVTLRDTVRRVNNMRAFQSMHMSREGDKELVYDHVMQMRRRNASLARAQWVARKSEIMRPLSVQDEMPEETEMHPLKAAVSIDGDNGAETAENRAPKFSSGRKYHTIAPAVTFSLSYNPSEIP